MNSNMNNNINVEQLMAMLSKMNKNDLQKGLAQASQFLNSTDKNEILKKLKNNQ